MIFGVGTDVVEISRVASTYERFGEHFGFHILRDIGFQLFGAQILIFFQFVFFTTKE